MCQHFDFSENLSGLIFECYLALSSDHYRWTFAGWPQTFCYAEFDLLKKGSDHMGHKGQLQKAALQVRVQLCGSVL